MQFARNDWTPLIESIKEKISADGKRELLFKMINDLRYVTQMNFGASGIARPESWAILNKDYARKFKKGNRTPTLILKGDLIRGFRTSITENSASLTNVVLYADEHQEGAAYKNLPARPYYPINEDGSLTEFAWQRQVEIVQKHFQ